MLAVATLLGIGARSLWEWYRREPLNGVAVALFVCNWPFLFIYMRGGLGVDYHRHVMAVAPLLLAVGVGRVRRRRADRVAAGSPAMAYGTGAR